MRGCFPAELHDDHSHLTRCIFNKIGEKLTNYYVAGFIFTYFFIYFTVMQGFFMFKDIHYLYYGSKVALLS